MFARFRRPALLGILLAVAGLGGCAVPAGAHGWRGAVVIDQPQPYGYYSPAYGPAYGPPVVVAPRPYYGPPARRGPRVVGYDAWGRPVVVAPPPAYYPPPARFNVVVPFRF